MKEEIQETEPKYFLSSKLWDPNDGMFRGIMWFVGMMKHKYLEQFYLGGMSASLSAAELLELSMSSCEVVAGSVGSLVRNDWLCAEIILSDAVSKSLW